MAEKDSFKFLQEAENFVEVKYNNGDFEYYYEKEINDEFHHCSIVLPENKKYNINWYYVEQSDEKTVHFNKLESTPEWFQELVGSAERKKNQLVRLRDLFKAKTVKPPTNASANWNEDKESLDYIFDEFWGETENV